MTAPTQLFLEFNDLDGRWKVLDKNGFAFGDGFTPKQAIASARIVSESPILAFNENTGDYDEVDL